MCVRKLFVCGLAVLSVQVMAGEVATLGDLSDVQADTVRLKALAARESAQQEYQSKTSSRRGFDEPPVASGVYGSNGRMYVELIFSNGQTASLMAGDVVPGGYKVKSVGLNKVELTKGKEVIVLGFSGVAPTEKADAPAPNVMGYPMMAPPMPANAKK